MNRSIENICFTLVVLSVLPWVPGTAIAQDGTLEEITVTARRRAESLQETPVSVIAFSPEALEKQNIADLADLSSKLPNVFMGAGGGLGSNNGSFYIRGLGSGRNAINQESAVALYIDDSYYGRSDGALLDVVDVESIEVLRGPQGTLFGRNATAGAVRYITKKPDDAFDAKLQVTAGSDSRFDVKGSVNLPLSETSALRLSAASVNQDGFQTNAIGQKLGERATNVVRGYLRVAPSDSFEILASLDHSDTDSNGSAYSLLAINDNPNTTVGPNVVGNGVNQALAAGFDVLSDPIGSTTQSGSTLLANNDTSSTGASLTLNWELTNGMQLRWANTYRNVDIKSNFDFDGTRAPLFENQNVVRESTSLSSEIQLSGSAADDRLSWIGGLFYYDESSDDSRDSVQSWSVRGSAFFDQVGPGAATTTTRTTLPHDLESVAVFGQVTYDFTDTFSITTGLRYTDDEKRIRQQEFNNAGDSVQFDPLDPTGSTGDLIVDRSDSWDAVSGRLSFEYQATDNAFIYVSYARGFRAGGINDRIRQDLAPPTYGVTSFDEETVDTYEIGLRSDLAGDTLRLNLTYFLNDFQDLQFGSQVARFDNGNTRTVVNNIGEAESSGLEAEIVWLPTDNLRFDANIGIMDSEISQGGASIDNGTRLPYTPDYQYNIGAEYAAPMTAGGELTFRLDFAGVDDFFSNAARNQLFILDGYETLDVNVSYRAASEKWSAGVFGKNVTDEDYFTQALSFVNDAPFGVIAGTPARGSQYGVKFEYFFGE